MVFVYVIAKLQVGMREMWNFFNIIRSMCSVSLLSLQRYIFRSNGQIFFCDKNE